MLSAHLDGHQHGGRKLNQQKHLSLSFAILLQKREFISRRTQKRNNIIILYSNTKTVQIAEFPEIRHFLNPHHSSLVRHVNAT